MTVTLSKQWLALLFVQNSPLAKINELKGAMLLMLNTVRVLLADDHPFVREGVRDALEKTDDIVLVGEATTNDEVLEMVRHLQPEIILLDLVMPGQPTSEIVQRLKRMDSVKILIFSGFCVYTKVVKLLDMGVEGYFLKSDPPASLYQAIRSVAKGGCWFSKGVMQVIHGGREDKVFVHLTVRERQVLDLISKGWDNSRIALELHLTQQTVCNYTSCLYKKIGVKSRAEAIIWAINRGI